MSHCGSFVGRDHKQQIQILLMVLNSLSSNNQKLILVMVHYQVVFVVFFFKRLETRVRKTLIQPYTTHKVLYCTSTIFPHIFTDKQDKQDKQNNIAVSPCGPELPVEEI
ncbi:unnamed protein product [Rhizopus stolonifer]